MLSSTSTSLTEMKSRQHCAPARFGSLMRRRRRRRLPPFLASEESDGSRSRMSVRAQASVLRDADGCIINAPPAAPLELERASPPRLADILPRPSERCRRLFRRLRIHQVMRSYPTAAAIASRAIYSTLIQRIPQLRLQRE